MKNVKIGMFKAMMQCSNYQKMSEDERTSLRTERLRKMVTYARENSPIMQSYIKM